VSKVSNTGRVYMKPPWSPMERKRAAGHMDGSVPVSDLFVSKRTPPETSPSLPLWVIGLGLSYIHGPSSKPRAAEKILNFYRSAFVCL
jgi:hypothetical protein